MKIYAVVLNSWWACSDSGHDESGTLYTFTTKDLAVEYIVREIENLRRHLIKKYSSLNGEYWKSELERIKNFKYDVDKIKEECFIDITDLAQNEMWGDNNAYQIEEHEVLDELPKEE